MRLFAGALSRVEPPETNQLVGQMRRHVEGDDNPTEFFRQRDRRTGSVLGDTWVCVDPSPIASRYAAPTPAGLPDWPGFHTRSRMSGCS